MADGLNEARALRVTEIMRDYQEIQRKISAYSVNVTAAVASEAGFVILRQCQAEARALLNAPYPVELMHPPTGPGEAAKRQLQRVIVDASARRFQAQKAFLRATSAMKWINVRRQLVPNGQKPTAAQRAPLQQAETTMRNEIVANTNQRIWAGLRTKDQQAGYWQQDDPSLTALQTWISSHPFGSSPSSSSS